MAMTEHEAEQRHRTKAGRNRDAMGDTQLVCECADLRCNAKLAASADDYAHRSRGAAGFWVRPGHEIMSIERVVERNDDYVVVQKLVATPAYVINGRYAATR
jgi:hypothetical protein